MIEINNLYSDVKKKVILTLCHAKTNKIIENNYPTKAGIVSVVSGMLTVNLSDGKEIYLKSGDTFIFSTGCEYKIKCLGLVELYSAHFRVSDFIDDEGFKIYNKEATSTLTGLFNDIKGVVDGGDYKANKILDNILFIDKELESRSVTYSAFSEISIKSAFVFILSLILQYFVEDKNYNRLKTETHKEEIKNTINYITEHLGEKLTLDELSKIAMMGKTNYSVAFKRIMGMTVWDYILNARVELATNYLLEKSNNLSIAEIAMLCGFNNTANFNKVFKKIKGKTPREYIKKSDNPCF